MVLLASLCFMSSVTYASSLRSSVNAIYEQVAKFQTENYYNYVGTYVFQEKDLSIFNLAELQSEKDFTDAFGSCLYNTDAKSFPIFKKEIETILKSEGSLTWYSDIENPGSYFGEVKNPRPLYKKYDEYGGPGGYFPRCSVVVQTERGHQYLFHAIDTY